MEKIGRVAERVPDGFINWYRILERTRSETLYEIDMLLKEGDFFGAIMVFENETTYNKEKVWH